MKKIFNKKLWSYVGRFSIIHVIIYSVFAVIFLYFQESLPVSKQIALDFFEPYRNPQLIVILEEIMRGAILALILYPFYDLIVKGNRGWLILFGVLWGLVIMGSVEPRPGSIEGLYYTKTALLEHGAVLIAGAVQIFLFSRLFLYWERWSNKIGRGVNCE